ncbi:hypothetical protein QVD17_31342 [Tagetes erecta]|uniref:Cupin type-1 domain-containing protein n=1 Tax=Tagetes erecta TaxID=13708 RepID=A0AAD8K4D0_TARER|nr:hypothetical protein QVD17_31342 [Tagetes erecta]
MSNTSLSISVVILSAYFIASTCFFFPHSTSALHGGSQKKQDGAITVPVPMPGTHGTVVTKDRRISLFSTEFGEIWGVKVSDGKDGFYDLQFITMEPNSIFVPAYLHSDMVFFVTSGSGTLSWVDLEKDSDKLRQVELRTGDVYRLPTGSFFYFQSNLDSDRRKFRINAIFSDSKDEIREGSSFGAYSNVGDLLLGFDAKILQAALNVDEEVIQGLKSGGRQPMIVHGVSKAEQVFEVHYRTMRAFFGFMENGMIELNKNKKDKAYNMLEAKHDFENCNGWSLIVTRKQMDALKDSDFGIFMVNLTRGAMMGPHWNPMTAEIAVVLSGRGMVHVVCPSSSDEVECKNTRFRVEEGDVFVVPRYHPMAQISFNNGSFVFFGFTTTQKKNHPQYLVGSASVFQVLDKRVLATSLGVSNVTMDEILSAQKESIILECTSCAEEEERLMEEEIQRQKEEEEARKREEEEEARKKEEEEREREEEEERKKEEEEEEARRQEEEARKREEEEARREEEEARKREEEAARREEEEARREEEEAREREEEAARREEARREEEEARKREEEEARREEEKATRQQEEEAQRQQEEAATKRRQQEEEAAREQEEAMRRKQEHEAARRQEDTKGRREEQEGSRRQEEAMRRKQEHEAARRQEEAKGRREEQEGTSRQDEAVRRRQEQDAARQQEEAMRQREEHGGLDNKVLEA